MAGSPNRAFMDCASEAGALLLRRVSIAPLNLSRKPGSDGSFLVMSNRAPHEAMRNPLPNRSTTVGVVEPVGVALPVVVVLLTFSNEVLPENLRSHRDTGSQFFWSISAQ